MNPPISDGFAEFRRGFAPQRLQASNSRRGMHDVMAYPTTPKRPTLRRPGMPRPVAALFAVVALSALAGCATKTPDAALAGGATSSGDPHAMAAMEGHAMAMAPAWQVGQWWTHHWYFSPQDTTGFTVKAIVVANETGGLRLATDDRLDAASHASFYFHDQGVMGQGADWAVRDFDGAFQFPWYSFPLHDGKTWTGHEENLDFNLQKVSQDLTLTAHAINGTPGAFDIEARTSDGVRARYDYQPSIGWFSQYMAFDPKDPDPTHFNVKMVDEAHGTGWTGTYYTAKADFLLDSLTVVAPPGGVVQDDLKTSFTVTSTHTDVLAIPFAFAAAGGANTELVAPDGRHWESYVVGDQDGNSVQQAQPGLLFVPAAAGDWRCATAGAGVFAFGGGCLAWGVTVAGSTL